MPVVEESIQCAVAAIDEGSKISSRRRPGPG